MNRHYPPVADRAGYRCEYCHASEESFNFHFEVEHIIPSSRRGADHLNRNNKEWYTDETDRYG